MKVLKQHGINVEANKEFSDSCALGKARQQSSGTQKSRPSVVGKQINADVCGPMVESSVDGARYYACFKDDYSKFHRVFFITTKSEVADCLLRFLKPVKIVGHVTKVLLSDSGKELNCEAVWKVLEEHGINAPTHHAIYSQTEWCSRARKSYDCGKCGKRLLCASHQWFAERNVG